MLRLRPPLSPTHVWLKSACNFTVGPARMWFLCIHGSASLDSVNLRVVWNHAPAKLLQSCPTVRPHKWKPTKLPRPWDSPGKNTRVGCHFLLQCMKVKSESEVAQLCPTLSDPMDCSLSGSSIHGFSRQEYWSGVPLPSPVWDYSVYLLRKESAFQWSHAVQTVLFKGQLFSEN